MTGTHRAVASNNPDGNKHISKTGVPNDVRGLPKKGGAGHGNWGVEGVDEATELGVEGHKHIHGEAKIVIDEGKVEEYQTHEPPKKINIVDPESFEKLKSAASGSK